MDIENKITKINYPVKINGKQKVISRSKLEKIIESNSFFSGSIEFSSKSSFVFNFVNSASMMYIFNEIMQNSEGAKIEIRTYASITEKIQQSSYH